MSRYQCERGSPAYYASRVRVSGFVHELAQYAKPLPLIASIATTLFRSAEPRLGFYCRRFKILLSPNDSVAAKRLFTRYCASVVMDDDAAFTSRLIGFGLSEKEARLYLHLLKYGPKTPSPLAKSLKTYREDVHRGLSSLIEKGMVRPSLDSPTIYAAVDLDAALDSAVKKQESELREMEARKRELQELSKQQRFRPSDEVTTFKIIKSVKELVAATATLVSYAKNTFLYVVPAEMLVKPPCSA